MTLSSSALPQKRSGLGGDIGKPLLHRPSRRTARKRGGFYHDGRAAGNRWELIDIAIERNLDIVSEKPIASCMAEACNLYRKINQAGIKMVVTMSHRMECEKQTIERMIKSGEYGNLNYIVSRMCLKQRRPLTSATRPAETLVPGIIYGGVIHNLDTLRGMAGANAKTVYSQGWRFDADDTTFGGSCLITMEMENGVRCLAEYSEAGATSPDGWSHEYYRAECSRATLESHGPDSIRVRSQIGFPILPTRLSLYPSSHTGITLC